MQRVRTVWTGVAGSPWYSNLFFKGTDEPSAEASHALVAALMDNLAGAQPINLRWTVDSVVSTIDPVSGDITAQYDAGEETGVGDVSSSNKLLPSSLQVLGRLKTGLFAGGRQIQGKFYWPGLTELASTTTGDVAPAYQSSLVTAFAPLLAATNPLVVWSRKNGTEVPVVSCTAWSKFAVLRSRRD